VDSDWDGSGEPPASNDNPSALDLRESGSSGLASFSEPFLECSDEIDVAGVPEAANEKPLPRRLEITLCSSSSSISMLAGAEALLTIDRLRIISSNTLENPGCLARLLL
jgi:hypothetical protein